MVSFIPPIALPVRVLVVEDEPLIRMLAVDTLTDAGFDVLESPHADHALDTLVARARNVRILFSDIHMPGTMTGLTLANFARRRWPWISVLLTSGKMTPAIHEMPHGSRFLAKPYSIGSVLTHVQELAIR